MKVADVVICGAGIAGVATAYHLAIQRPSLRVMLVDERPPLSLTSDKSTECYRNWWPAPDDAMVRMMNRSIDILEELAQESENLFHLNRRGYLFGTADPARVDKYRQAARRAEALGAGQVRIHSQNASDYQPSPPESYLDQPAGADLLLEPQLIQRYFPVLSHDTCAVLHVRRAGWLSAQQLGMYLLRKARAAGVQLLAERVEAVTVKGNKVRGVEFAGGAKVDTGVFVNAAGPFLGSVAGMIGLELPVRLERHLKVAFRDSLGVLPRAAPMFIWSDPQQLDWEPEERVFLSSLPESRWLLDTLPAGVHTRPEGGGDSQVVLLLWEYNSQTCDPVFPIQLDPEYPEIALRGISRMIPGMKSYLNRLPKPVLDGGYYVKTQENRPLAGPLAVEGAYVLGALSGFGIMAAPALGELLSQEILGVRSPSYAPAFFLDRYSDPEYQALLENWGESWQL